MSTMGSGSTKRRCSSGPTAGVRVRPGQGVGYVDLLKFSGERTDIFGNALDGLLAPAPEGLQCPPLNLGGAFNVDLPGIDRDRHLGPGVLEGAEPQRPDLLPEQCPRHWGE